MVFLKACALAILAVGKPCVVVFDFESPNPSDGKKVASTFRAKLLRTRKLSMPEELDLGELLGDFKPSFDRSEHNISFAKETFGADIVCWGKVERYGELWEIKIRISSGKSYRTYERKCQGYPQVSKFLTQLAEITSGGKLPKPYQSPPPQRGESNKPNLLKNGDFEKGTEQPEGWERCDRFSTFWVEGGPQPGRCIKIDTDILLSQWKQWREAFKNGATNPPEKIPTKPPKYDTVAGTHGVHFYSDWIPVKPDSTYRITADVKGPSVLGGPIEFFPKIFVKGYDLFEDETGKQWREVFRAYLACRTRTNGKQWERFTRLFHPTSTTPRVKRMRVILYAYWPPGVYYFDNIRLTEVKD